VIFDKLKSWYILDTGEIIFFSFEYIVSGLGGEAIQTSSWLIIFVCICWGQ
jgi:hypothetical protein